MKNKFLSTLMVGAAFVMLTLNACTNDMLETAADENNPEVNPNEVLFIANNFAAEGGVESRTLISNEGKFAWTEGDLIGVLPDEGSQVYFKIDNINESEPNKANFDGGAWDLKAGNNYAAYYPFIQDIMLDRTEVPVDYSVQTYSARQDGKVSPSHDYMAALPVEREDGGLNFQFKHLGALVEVQFSLPEDEAVHQFILSADQAIFPVKGTFNLNTTDAVAITPAKGQEANTVTVNVKNLTAEAGKPVSVFFMMPPMAEAGTNTWKAEVVYGGNNTRMEFEISTAKENLKAGYYYTLETDAMELPAAIEITNIGFLQNKVNNALSSSGVNKLRYVTDSPVVSETVVYTDDNDVKAYAVRNGDWLEIHTLAKSFKLSGDISYMFYAYYYPEFRFLTSLDLSGFDTSSVTKMSYMFYECSGLLSLDLSGFDTSSVTDMSHMFRRCSSLTSLDLRGFDTSSVTDMSGMFGGCWGLTSLDLSGFDTSFVTDMGSMFRGCSGLTSLDLSGFDTSSVTNMSYMFSYCSGLTSLDLSGFDTSYVTNMSEMFYYCLGLTSLDLSGFDTSSVTNMSNMFYECSSLTSLDLSSFKTSSVTDMGSMFRDCSSLPSLDLSGFDTSSVKNMSYMFYECFGLTSLNLSSFDTSSVTEMCGMFAGCSGLPSLDLRGFDTSSVTDMGGMFRGCSGLPSLDLSGFDTSKVQNMYDMFYNCSGLTSLDLSCFDTSKVEYMSGMFMYCSSLTSLDLSSFNTSSVTDMGSMFSNCSGLTSLDLSGFTFISNGSYWDMFYNLNSNAVIYVKSDVEKSFLENKFSGKNFQVKS